MSSVVPYKTAGLPSNAEGLPSFFVALRKPVPAPGIRVAGGAIGVNGGLVQLVQRVVFLTAARQVRNGHHGTCTRPKCPSCRLVFSLTIHNLSIRNSSVERR